MKFEDFSVDQVLEFGDHTVTESEILEFAEQYDPQPFHIDREFAARSRWGGLICSGFQTCGFAMRMVADHVLKGSESIGSPGLEYVKWPNPVRAGDQLRMRLHVHETRVSGSCRYGIVKWHWLMLNQLDQPVLDLVAVSMFEILGETANLS
jgi:acyl dehydratase